MIIRQRYYVMMYLLHY